MAFWPFSKAFGAGLVNNDVPTHSQLNKLDEQQAQAADGALWSDAALVKNWRRSAVVTGMDVTAESSDASQACWSPLIGKWVAFGRNSGNPTVATSYDGVEWSTGSIPAHEGLTPRAAAANPAGIVLVGGSPGSASTKKLRRSTDGGLTWLGADIGAADTTMVSALLWHPAGAQFIAGRANGDILTSPDGVTWTPRTVPNADGRRRMATDGTTIVCSSGASSWDKCVTSLDGITWTERTFPSVASWSGLAWSPALGKFFAVGDSVAASSPDGVTWSSSGLTGPGASGFPGLACHGRLLLAATSHVGAGPGSVLYSIDGAVSWKLIRKLDSTSEDFPYHSHMPIVGDAQFLAWDPAGVFYSSLRGGL